MNVQQHSLNACWGVSLTMCACALSWEWSNTSLQAVMTTIDKIHAASPEEPALGLLERMQSENVTQMPVISDGHIVGVIARDAILHLLQTRLQLGHLA